jgi:hypothetical protein
MMVYDKSHVEVMKSNDEGMALGLFVGDFGLPRPCRFLLQKPAQLLHGTRISRAENSQLGRNVYGFIGFD